MSKQITVIPATGGAYSDLTIQPGTTPRDIKKQLGLAENFVLTRGRGTEPVPENEDIYASVTDGTKLYATTDVQWGGIIDTLLQYLERFLQSPPPSRAAPVEVETRPKLCID